MTSLLLFLLKYLKLFHVVLTTVTTPYHSGGDIVGCVFRCLYTDINSKNRRNRGHVVIVNVRFST